MIELTEFDPLNYIKDHGDIIAWLETQLEQDHSLDEVRSGILIAIAALRRWQPNEQPTTQG